MDAHRRAPLVDVWFSRRAGRCPCRRPRRRRCGCPSSCSSRIVVSRLDRCRGRRPRRGRSVSSSAAPVGVQGAAARDADRGGRVHGSVSFVWVVSRPGRCRVPGRRARAWWCSSRGPPQPLGSMPCPWPAETSVAVLIVSSPVNRWGRSPRHCRHGSASSRSSSRSFSRGGRCRHRRRHGCAWSSSSQPSGSMVPPPPARTVVVVFMAITWGSGETKGRGSAAFLMV